MTRLTSIFVSALLVATACVQQPTNGAGDSTAPPSSVSPGTQEGDWAAIVRLEDQARAIAKTSGCASVDACRTAPVGNRACGGPRYYIAYCSATTDSVALFRKLDEVAAAENAYNRKYQLASTCEFRMPPSVTFEGGQCGPATQSSK